MCHLCAINCLIHPLLILLSASHLAGIWVPVSSIVESVLAFSLCKGRGVLSRSVWGWAMLPLLVRTVRQRAWLL